MGVWFCGTPVIRVSKEVLVLGKRLVILVYFFFISGGVDKPKRTRRSAPRPHKSPLTEEEKQRKKAEKREKRDARTRAKLSSKRKSREAAVSEAAAALPLAESSFDTIVSAAFAAVDLTPWRVNDELSQTPSGSFFENV